MDDARPVRTGTYITIKPGWLELHRRTNERQGLDRDLVVFPVLGWSDDGKAEHLPELVGHGYGLILETAPRMTASTLAGARYSGEGSGFEERFSAYKADIGRHLFV